MVLGTASPAILAATAVTATAATATAATIAARGGHHDQSNDEHQRQQFFQL